MSDCIKNCQLCPRLILSTAVNYEASSNNLIVNLPAGSYGNKEKYCIVIAQSLPDVATINAPVVFTITGGTARYAFVNCDCTPVLASQLRTRRKYTTRVNTSIGTGVFKYVGSCLLPKGSNTVAQSLPIVTA